MDYVIICNFLTVSLLIGFTILLKIGDLFDDKVERLFAIGITCVASLVVLDTIDYNLSLSENVNDFRYFTSSLGYIIRPTILGLFISMLLRKGEQKVYMWIPIIIFAVISLTNYWTHIMFHFDEVNQFTRGTLGFLPHILSFIYMVILGFNAVKRFKVTDFGEILVLFYVLFVCLVSIIVETAFSAKFILNGAMINSIVVYYTYLYVQVYKTDGLTGVFNRISFKKDSVKRYGKKMSIIVSDMNNLKDINDELGHNTGDEALSTIAKILKKASDNRFRIYRVGGDEFMLIGVNQDIEVAKSVVDEVREELKKTSYTSSFGYASYEPGQDFRKACGEADKMMYVDKMNYKHKNCCNN